MGNKKEYEVEVTIDTNEDEGVRFERVFNSEEECFDECEPLIETGIRVPNKKAKCSICEKVKRCWGIEGHDDLYLCDQCVANIYNMERRNEMANQRKKYDISKAELIGKHNWEAPGLPGEKLHKHQSLYQTEKGEFFLHYIDSTKDIITKYSVEEAIHFCAEYCGLEVVEKHFDLDLVRKYLDYAKKRFGFDK